MSLSIDPGKCQAHGRCALASPDVFDVDDELGKTAVHCVDTGESRTWAEFDQRVGAVVSGLRDALGVRPGDRVYLLAENDVRTFELHFACVRLGAIFEPLNWRLGLTELRGIVDDCRPPRLAHDDEHQAIARRLAAGHGLPLLSWGAPTASSGYEATGHRGRLRPRGVARPRGDHPDHLHVRHQRPAEGGHRREPDGAVPRAEHGGHLAVRRAGRTPPEPAAVVLAGGLNTFTSPMFYWGQCRRVAD